VTKKRNERENGEIEEGKMVKVKKKFR